MTKRYTGGVVSSSSPTVNAAGASGVFTLPQATNAVSNNNWPPFKVEKSLRFRAAAGSYLSKTPSVTGNQKTWTWSAWVKRGTLGSSSQALLASTNNNIIGFPNMIKSNIDCTFDLNKKTKGLLNPEFLTHKLVTLHIQNDPWYKLFLYFV